MTRRAEWAWESPQTLCGKIGLNIKKSHDKEGPRPFQPSKGESWQERQATCPLNTPQVNSRPSAHSCVQASECSDWRTLSAYGKRKRNEHLRRQTDTHLRVETALRSRERQTGLILPSEGSGRNAFHPREVKKGAHVENSTRGQKQEAGSGSTRFELEIFLTRIEELQTQLNEIKGRTLKLKGRHGEDGAEEVMGEGASRKKDQGRDKPQVGEKGRAPVVGPPPRITRQAPKDQIGSREHRSQGSQTDPTPQALRRNPRHTNSHAHQVGRFLPWPGSKERSAERNQRSQALPLGKNQQGGKWRLASKDEEMRLRQRRTETTIAIETERLKAKNRTQFLLWGQPTPTEIISTEQPYSKLHHFEKRRYKWPEPRVEAGSKREGDCGFFCAFLKNIQALSDAECCRCGKRIPTHADCMFCETHRKTFCQACEAADWRSVQKNVWGVLAGPGYPAAVRDIARAGMEKISSANISQWKNKGTGKQGKWRLSSKEDEEQFLQRRNQTMIAIEKERLNALTRNQLLVWRRPSPLETNSINARRDKWPYPKRRTEKCDFFCGMLRNASSICQQVRSMRSDY